MIKLTKLNGDEIFINPELIETVDSHPDTTIKLTTGNKIIVREPVETLIRFVMEYRKEINETNRGKDIKGGR